MISENKSFVHAMYFVQLLVVIVANGVPSRIIIDNG